MFSVLNGSKAHARHGRREAARVSRAARGGYAGRSFRRAWVFIALALVGQGAALAAPRSEEAEERQAPGLATETQRAVVGAPTRPQTCSRQWRAIASSGVVLQIDIHDVIDPGMAAYVVRSLEEAAARPDVALVMLHMNTPGGRVDSAQVIKDALLRSSVPTATYIDSHALSAGALVAYATDVIIVSTGATMGAATPILVGEDGVPKATGEKFVSAVRGIFRATAEAKGRDPHIAEAMVDAQVDVPALKPNGKLVTLTHDELLTWCVADRSAASMADAITGLGLSPERLEHREISWAETLTRWLTDPAISSVLMSLGILGIMIELKAPGLGAGSVIAVLGFGLFFGGHLFAHLAGLGDVLLLLAGVVLVGIEVAVPGHVVPGVLGVGAIVAALGMAMVGGDLSMAWDVGEVQSAIWRVSGALTGTFLVFLAILRWLPHNRVVDRLVLSEAIRGGSHEDAPGVAPGERGVATSKVLGSGKARFGNALYDVICPGTALEVGTELVVVQVRPGRIEVAPASAHLGPPPTTAHAVYETATHTSTEPTRDETT